MNNTIALVLSAFLLVYGITGIIITHYYSARMIFDAVVNTSKTIRNNFNDISQQENSDYYGAIIVTFTMTIVTSCILPIICIFVFLFVYILIVIFFGAPLGTPLLLYRKFFPEKV